MRLISSFLPWKINTCHCLNTVCSDNWGKLTMFLLSLFPLLVWSGKTTTQKKSSHLLLVTGDGLLWFLPLKSIVSHFPTYPTAYFHSSAEALHGAPLVKYTSQTSCPIQLGLFIWPGLMFLLKSKKGIRFFFFPALANTSSAPTITCVGSEMRRLLQWAWGEARRDRWNKGLPPVQSNSGGEQQTWESEAFPLTALRLKIVLKAWHLSWCSLHHST